MADVDTYTATKCGPINGGIFEIPVDDVDGWPAANTLGVVQVDSVNVCVTINRTSSKKTPAEEVTVVIDSHTTTCEACEERWG